MANEVTTRASAADDAALMITSAIEKGLSAEGIEKLADVYLKMKSLQAEQDFNAALLAFQRDCPAIAKDTEGVHKKKYAPLAKIITSITPALQTHQLSYRFDSVLTERGITSTCTVSHAGGHSSQATFSAPIDPSPGMSKTHGVASAVSFSQRYALQQALGIVTGQGDDDGKALLVGELLSPEQVATIQSLLEETKADQSAFFRFVGHGITNLEEIAAYDYTRIESALKAKKRGAA